MAKCPRCKAQLRRTQDMQRATRFEYFRCPNDHGRLITFFDFLKEKDFVKPLTPAQIAELRKNVQQHQLLELRRAGRSREGLGRAGIADRRCRCWTCSTPSGWSRSCETPTAPISRSIPALPLALARARREAERCLRGLPGHEPWDDEIWSLGLVGAGLTELFRLIKRDS